MEVVFHLGVQCTDEGQLHYCLARNRRRLAEEEGIIVAYPGRFRPVFRETLRALDGQPAPPEVQEVMLDSILHEDDPQRIIFSNDAFLAGIPRMLEGGVLYREAGRRCAGLSNLFPQARQEFWIAVRNPATLLPAAFHKTKGQDFAAFISRCDPLSLRWSDTIGRIRAALPPEAALKVWCNEDSPFIWRQLVREIADCSAMFDMIGIDDYLKTVLTEEGLERMEAYLKARPPANEAQRRRILGAFLDKFERPDETQNVSAPDWDEPLIDAMTDIYEEDLFEIERMAGVEFISP